MTIKSLPKKSLIEKKSEVYAKDNRIPIRHRKCFGRVSAPLQEEMNSLFDEIFVDTETEGKDSNVTTPVTKFSETDKAINIEIALSDVPTENLDIHTTYNFITISGENHKPKPICPSFHRTFSLPETANTAKAKASLSNGILRISIPKKAVR